MNGLITNVEQAFTTKGAEYRKVTILDDKGKTTTKNVFDNLKEEWSLLEENKYREFKMEKSGQFWNVIDVLEVETPEPQPSDHLLPRDQKVIDEAKKSVSFDPTRKSIERQTSLKAATDWCVAKVQGGEDIKTEQLITVAGIFESYLENGLSAKKKVEP